VHIRETVTSSNESDDEDDCDVWDVKEVTDHRDNDGTTIYKTYWIEGVESTWEPEACFNCMGGDLVLGDYWRKKWETQQEGERGEEGREREKGNPEKREKREEEGKKKRKEMMEKRKIIFKFFA